MLVPENCAGQPLSPRERQCLVLTACGRTAKEIAAILDLGYGTVRNYLDQARRKLDAVNLVQAVACAIAFANPRAKPTLVPENCAGRPLSPRERQCLALAACAARTAEEIPAIPRPRLRHGQGSTSTRRCRKLDSRQPAVGPPGGPAVARSPLEPSRPAEARGFPAARAGRSQSPYKARRRAAGRLASDLSRLLGGLRGKSVRKRRRMA